MRFFLIFHYLNIFQSVLRQSVHKYATIYKPYKIVDLRFFYKCWNTPVIHLY